MEHEQELRTRTEYIWVKDGDRYALMESGPARHGTFTFPDPPDLTGEDEGVDMRDQPDIRELDRILALESINQKALADPRWGTLTDSEIRSLASAVVDGIHGKDQPDRVGSEGAD